MRVHLNTDRTGARTDIMDALDAAKRAGKVSAHVYFDRFDHGNSRSHQTAVELHLEASCEGRQGGCTAGHRWANSGKYGAESDNNGTGTRAATYDEWGWFLAYLFAQYPDAWAGQYRGRDSFHALTESQGRVGYRLTAANLPVSA